MIADCHDADLPEPDFEQRGPHFVVTLWRDWLTDAVIVELGISERQRQAVDYVKRHGQISSGEYQEEVGVEPRTATRDLADLVKIGVLVRHGQKRGAYYTLQKKSDKNATFQT